MFQVKLSEATAARRRIPVLLVDITDGFTPEVGVVTPTINISKNGATVATGAGTWTEIGNGQYYYEFTTGEVDTLGWVSVNIEKATVSRDYNAVVQIMAYDALDSVRLGLTALPNAAAGANGGLPTGNASGQVSVATLAANSITNSVIDATAATEIAGAVWDEPYASHTTAGSFGKLMDILRKANYVVEGTTTAGSTTTSINTNLTGYVTDAFDNQTILFISGALAGTCGLINANTSGGGVLTLAEVLPGTPATGVDFVILGTHVHTKEGIADGVLARKLDSSGNESVANGAYTSASTDRTVRQALRILRNKVDASTGATIDVYNEAGTVVVWSLPLTTALADPIVKVG